MAVDPAARTVYVANDQANIISVIGADIHVVTATIEVGTGPTGVAVDPNTHILARRANGYSPRMRG